MIKCWETEREHGKACDGCLKSLQESLAMEANARLSGGSPSYYILVASLSASCNSWVGDETHNHKCQCLPSHTWSSLNTAVEIFSVLTRAGSSL